MRQFDAELLAYVAEPTRLPTAYTIISWLDDEGPKRNAPSEARELLSRGTNLRTALRIRDVVAAVETHAFETFWANVETLLKNMLDDSDFIGWRVLMSKPAHGHGGFISLIPSSEAIGENEMFQVCAENLSVPEKKERGFFGIWKSENNEHDPELSTRLKQAGFKANDNWSGWKWFHACGMPDFTIRSDNVIRLNADNHSNDKPLATEVSLTLWQLFDSCRLRLEELNRVVHKIRF